MTRQRLVRYAIEMIGGIFIAGLILLVLAATVASVPFVYQGY